MSIIAPFIYITGLTLLVLSVFKKRFGASLPVALMAAVLTVYLSGFVGDLRYGFYVTLAASAAGYITAVVDFFKTVDRKEQLGRIFSTGFFAFVIFYALIIFINRNRVISLWDEVSHWATMAKEMCRLNDFYSGTESMLASHKDYPPAMTLFQYIFCKLSGGYQEGFLYRAQNLFSLSLFLPSVDEIKTDKFSKTLLAAVGCAALIIVGNTLFSPDNNFYNALYVDSLLGVFFAYCVMCAFTSDKFGAFSLTRLSLALCTLLITKQFALVIYALALFVIFIDLLLFKREQTPLFDLNAAPKEKAKYSLSVIFAAVIAPLLTRLLWSFNLRSSDANIQFASSEVELFGGFRYIFGFDDGSFRPQAVKNFISEVFGGVFVQKPIALSCLAVMLLSAALIALLSLYARGSFKKGRFAALDIAVFIGWLGFSYAMLLTWLYSFGEVAGLMLISFVRYMSAYSFGVFALVIMLFIIITARKREEGKSGAGVIFIIVLAVLVGLSAAAGNFDLTEKPAYSSDSLVNFSGDIDVIRNNTQPEDKVYIITQLSDDYEMFVFRYLLIPQYSNTDNYNLGAFQYSSADNVKEATSPEEFLDMLTRGGYAYVYIYATDDYLNETYAGIFCEGAPEVKALYRVEYRNGAAEAFTKIN